MSSVYVDDLHAMHGRTRVLTGLALTVTDTTLACVLGPSGCGKTTLLRIIAGFHHPAAGTVRVGGRTLDDATTHIPAERRRVGYLPQDGALFPHLTVVGNIGFGLRRRDRRTRVRDLLDLLDVAELADRYPHQLSGGQQQRVALARALAPRPEVVLLDEPFAALDATLRTRVRDEVAETLRKAGTTALLVTHDVDEALAVADTIAVLHGGRIAQAGTPDILYHRPADAFVARALGEANLVPAKLSGTRAATALGILPLTNPTLHHGPGTVLVRPHQLHVSSQPGPDSLEARVSGCRLRGHDYRVELATHPTDLPPKLIAYTTDAPPAIGQPVRLTVRGAVHPLDSKPRPDPSTDPPTSVKNTVRAPTVRGV